MSTQQEIYAAGSKNRPSMLNKDNYVPWSSRIIRYARSRPNCKMIIDSIENATPGEPDLPVPVPKSFHEQTNEELRENDIKWMDAYDQAIETILLGLPKDVYAAVDSCETTKEIWECYAGQVAQNQQGYNAWQNGGIQGAQNAGQNASVQSGGNQNGLVVVPRIANQNGTCNVVAVRAKDTGNRNQARCYNCRGLGHIARNCTARPRRRDAAYFQTQLLIAMGVQGNGNQNQIGNGNLVAARAEGNATGPRRRDAAYLQTQLLIAQKEKEGIQLQAEEYDLMAAAVDLDDIEEVNANCILMANLQQASTSGTQSDSTPVYDTDGSAEVHKNYDDNEIFNMFTQEEQYTELLEPISELHQVPQNDIDVVSEVTGVVQGREIVEQHPVNFEETRALYDSLYQNLATEVEKVNSVSRKLKETNAELTTELARYKNQERCFQNNQEKYNKLERCYQQSVYQEQCLSKKINALHLCTADDSLAKYKAMELDNERLLKAVVSQDVMNIVQKESVVDTSDLQTELERTKERFENCIIKKEIKYAKLWNDWYKKCTECKYDKISYDKAYKDMQQKIERLQAQLGDLKGKCKDTSHVSDTRNPLSQKLENKNVELESQVLNYARENAHLKVSYKNLFDSMSVSRAQTKTIIDSFQNELQSNIYKNAKLRTQLFKKASDHKDNTQNTSANTKFAKQPIGENFPKVGKTNALSKPVTSNSVYSSQEPKGVDNTKARRPQPRSNIKNDRVPSVSKSSRSKIKEAKVEEHHR
nr:hypothetical protein [Tanacetum cinerariifolium]